MSQKIPNQLKIFLIVYRDRLSFMMTEDLPLGTALELLKQYGGNKYSV